MIEAPYASVASFKDPDGIALELCAMKPRFWRSLVSRTGKHDAREAS